MKIHLIVMPALCGYPDSRRGRDDKRFYHEEHEDFTKDTKRFVTDFVDVSKWQTIVSKQDSSY